MKKLAITLLAALTLPLAAAHALTGLEVAKKASLASYYAGDDGSAQMLMKVYAKNSKKPIKKMFTMLKKDVTEGGEQLFFTYFTQPSDIKRTTFLVKKKIKGDDFRRLYMPASDKVLAISGARKQDPFMGSDFSYEDVSGRHFSKDKHKLLGTESSKGVKVHVIESTPKVKEEKIAKIKSWIDAKSFIPQKVEFIGHDGKVFKIFTAEKVQKIEGIPTIMKQVMVSPIEGTRTEILVNPKKVHYNLGLATSLFSERSLRNPPMKYLK